MKEKLDHILGRSNSKNILLNLINFGKLNFDNPIDFIDQLSLVLNENSTLKKEFLNLLIPVFRNINMQKFLTDFHIFSDDKVIKLFFKQIGDKILPNISDDQSLLSLMNEVLYNKANHNFVKMIPVDRWEKFYSVLFDEDSLIGNKEYIKKQIRDGAIILTDRIIGGITYPEILKISYIKDIEENPFQGISKFLILILQHHQVINKKILDDFNYQAQICLNYIDSLIDQKENKGISLKITVILTRIRQQLERISILLEALYSLDNESLSFALAKITKNWIHFYTRKSNVTSSLQSTVYVFTSLITWYNRQTGEKYITSTPKQYMKMLYSSLGGGLLVAILCFIKTQLSMNVQTPFLQALFYSLNYAWGFVAIYLLHWTLATKQPAMTAATLAHALNQDEKSANDYKEFGLFFTRLFRSQFIAFIGNVVAVFLSCIILYFFLQDFTDIQIINDHKAHYFINELIDLNPSIFWYGAIAGLFLFLSGLVSGATENYTKFHNIAERLYHHPILKRFLKERKRRIFVNWYQHNIGGIMGNVFLGFCLGGAFLIGIFLGIPFDIRHITFSAGNYAIALCHFNFDLNWVDFILGMIGVLGIGAFNFLVSFSLSLWVAMKSINVPTKEMGKILYSALKLFIKNPMRFFIPVK